MKMSVVNINGGLLFGGLLISIGLINYSIEHFSTPRKKLSDMNDYAKIKIIGAITSGVVTLIMSMMK